MLCPEQKVRLALLPLPTCPHDPRLLFSPTTIEQAAKTAGTGADGSVLQCLADARDKVQRGGCRSELAKVLVSHSQSASTNPVLMAAGHGDK